MLSVLLSAALAAGPGQLPAAAAPLRFDAVVVKQEKAPQVSLLYVVVTAPKADPDRLAELVVRYARAALREAARHRLAGADLPPGERPRLEANVVFLVRNAPGDRRGYVSGFSVAQLREIASAAPEVAKRLAGRHAWSSGPLPALVRRE